jgi:hypothetical protein
VAPGITLGTTLADLERLNGGPLTLTRFEQDPGASVTGWRGGRLASLDSAAGRRIQLSLAPSSEPPDSTAAAEDSAEPTELASDSPSVRRLGLRVSEIVLWFADAADTTASDSADGIAVLDASLLPATGSRAEEFVPAGWKVSLRLDQDLTGDGITDPVLHLIPASSTYEDGAVAAAPEAHALVILVTTGQNGLRRAGVATRLLQPAVPQWGIELQAKDGALVVHQNYGMTEVTDLTHQFRYDAATGVFALARKETFLYTRPLTQPTERVVEDYTTGERSITTGDVRDGNVVRESTTREPIPGVRVLFDEVDELADS